MRQAIQEPEIEQYSALRHLVNSIWGFWRGERKLMAFYTGYFDESGSESGDLFVFGGLVLDVEDPRVFERDWAEAIDPLAELHTSPFLAGGNGFEQWNAKRLPWKQELLRRAARVIAKHAFATFATALNMAAFRQISKEHRFDEKIAYPYALCARLSAVQMKHWSAPNGIPGRVKLVFENRSKEDSVEVTRVFVRDNLPVPALEPKGLSGLQAADLIAAIYARKIMRKQNFAQVQPAFAELYQGLHTTDILDGSTLRAMWNRIQPLIVERTTPPGERSGVFFKSEPAKRRKQFRKG